MTATPTFGGLIKLEKNGWDGVPESPSPFYFGAKDGLYLARQMLIGRGVVRQPYWPDNFPEFGFKNGDFAFKADPIPAKIMGQVVNFFERIYDRQHTEAAVLLVMHRETKEWRVFVPTQLVSGGGVNYVFEPNHIKDPWVLVGSIHSHCNFGAGHSSTDTGDAHDFDGLHCTIGQIKRDIPDIVAMIAMNTTLFHFDKKEFPNVFDFSEAKKHEAPEWWDRYVENTNKKIKPVGFELYEKYKKPTTVKNESKITQIGGTQKSPTYQTTGYNANDWSYNEKAKRMVHKSWTVKDDGTIVFNHPTPNQQNKTTNTNNNGQSYPRGLTVAELLDAGYRWDAKEGTWRFVGGSSETLHESAKFNARRAAERGVSWGKDGELDQKDRELLAHYGLSVLEEAEENWEDKLPKNILNAVFDSICITDEDADTANRNPVIAGDPKFWRQLFYTKLFDVIEVLYELGVKVDVAFERLLPEDIEAELLPGGPVINNDQIGAN